MYFKSSPSSEKMVVSSLFIKWQLSPSTTFLHFRTGDMLWTHPNEDILKQNFVILLIFSKTGNQHHCKPQKPNQNNLNTQPKWFISDETDEVKKQSQYNLPIKKKKKNTHMKSLLSCGYTKEVFIVNLNSQVSAKHHVLPHPAKQHETITPHWCQRTKQSQKLVRLDSLDLRKISALVYRQGAGTEDR